MSINRVKSGPRGVDVAKLAGVSTTTVSYVMNGNSGVQLPEETRQRVLAAAKELGYRPNPVASALKTGRTGMISVWMPNIQTSYFARVLHEIEKEGSKRPYQIIINIISDSVGQKVLDRASMPYTVDGIIVYGSSPWAVKLIEQTRGHSLPIVALGSKIEFANQVDSVALDFTEASNDAMAHLLGLGRTRIAFVNEGKHDATKEPRQLAYRAAMHQAGLPSEIIECPVNSKALSRIAVRDYVAANGCPEAFFCPNDDLAIAIYRALRDLGIRIPEDAAIVGCNGIEETEYLDPPLSTIILPLEEMSRQAWRLLDRRLLEPTAPVEHLTLISHLVIRQSSVL